MAACLVSASTGLAAEAEAVRDIKLSGALSVEVQMDAATNSDNPADERTDITQTTEAGLTLSLPRGFSVNSLAVFESVQDPAPGDDRFLEDNGLYIEELFLEWKQGRWGARGGKFGQNFGIAWDRAPGLWGSDLAEDYEIAEQIAAGGSLSGAAGPLGDVTLTASTFFSDRSILAESALTGRGTTSLADGGPGNTGGFQSFAVAVDTSGKHVSFHLGWLHRGTGEAGKVAETAIAAGASGNTAIGNIGVSPVFEIVRFEDREGTRGDTALYVTAAANLTWEKLSLALAHTTRRLNSVDDAQWQVSVGYELPYGFGMQAGYRRLEAAGIDSDTIGALISWGYEF